MNTELAVQDSTAPVALPDPSDQALDRLARQADAMVAAHKLGTALARTAMVPEIYQQYPAGKPENEYAADNATAAILYGAELGMSAIASLQNVFLVKGKAAVYARTMAAQVIAAGHQLSEVEAKDDSVTWMGRRGDTGIEFTATWTIARATQAGYTTNAKYKTNPIEMLRAKCQAEVCRTMAPEVLLGLAYSREELEMENPPVRVKSERISGGNAGLRDALGIKDAPVTDVSNLPEAEPTITSAQLKKLHAMLDDIGLGGASNREQALAYMGNIIDRELTSSKDLTSSEAQKVFEQIETDSDASQSTTEGA